MGGGERSVQRQLPIVAVNYGDQKKSANGTFYKAAFQSLSYHTAGSKTIRLAPKG
jgi:hypothetical protein